jgi:hypothetical protein
MPKKRASRELRAEIGPQHCSQKTPRRRLDHELIVPVALHESKSNLEFLLEPMHLRAKTQQVKL